MILFELAGATEEHPVYKALAVANGLRQYDFLRSIVAASMDLKRALLSQHILKALNFQAITCLHTNAGEYRPCKVEVGTGDTKYEPPDHYRVPALMEDFVDTVNRLWDKWDPVVLAAYVLWGLNAIHPFINGNGRTARAACYFVLCLRVGQWLPGTVTLPELLVRERDEYVKALKAVDATGKAGLLDLKELHALLSKLLQEQLASVPEAPGPPVPEPVAAAAEPTPEPKAADAPAPAGEPEQPPPQQPAS